MINDQLKKLTLFAKSMDSCACDLLGGWMHPLSNYEFNGRKNTWFVASIIVATASQRVVVEFPQLAMQVLMEMRVLDAENFHTKLALVKQDDIEYVQMVEKVKQFLDNMLLIVAFARKLEIYFETMAETDARLKSP